MIMKTMIEKNDEKELMTDNRTIRITGNNNYITTMIRLEWVSNE